MYYCTIYGIKVKSNFCITEGIQIEPTEDVEAFVEMGEVPNFIKEELKNNHVAEFRDKYCWIYITDLGYYYIENGNHIVIEKAGNDTEYTIMTFLTGLAFALLFTQKGYVPLHGSVLDYKGKGCLISGPSGSGKSSTAFELLKRGATFVADDIGMVDCDAMTVNPGFPVQRLCEDQIERLGNRALCPQEPVNRNSCTQWPRGAYCRQSHTPNRHRSDARTRTCPSASHCAEQSLV